MSRNSSGTYTLPAGNPVTSGTTISTTWANTTLGDLATELTSSLDRAGRGGMTAPLRTADGTVAAPAHSFTSEPGSGLYKAGTSDVRLSVAGVDFVTTSTIAFPGSAGGLATVKPTGANVGMVVQGNKNAADTGTDILLYSTATRTAGTLVSVQNPPNTPKLNVDYQGLLQLANTAALQPASILTAVTPAAGIAASASYWKDATGTVHVQGSVSGSGSAIVHGTVLFNLPAGFRPDSTRAFATLDTSKNVFGVQVAGTGDVTLIAPVSVTSAGSTNLANGGPGLFLDVIAFLARG